MNLEFERRINHTNTIFSDGLPTEYNQTFQFGYNAKTQPSLYISSLWPIFLSASLDANFICLIQIRKKNSYQI